jgi:branched-chain amino acid transport system substrate-binding protein
MHPSRVLPFTVLAIAVLGTPANGQATARQSAGQKGTRPLEIAMIGDLSGTAKSFGTNSRAALRAAITDINRHGGVRLADGAVGRFELTSYDDHCRPDDAVASLRRAAASHALIVVGPSCSAAAERLFRSLQIHVDDPADSGIQMPVFTDGAMQADLARISDWAFRNTPNESDMYRSLWAWIRRTHPDLRTVFGGEEADFAHSHSTWENIIRTRALDAGFTIAGHAGWSINDTKFTVPVTQLAATHADVVVLSAHAGTTCGMLRAMARQRIRPRLVIGLTSAATTETLAGCAAQAEGFMVPTSFALRGAESQRAARAVEQAGGVADLHSMAAWEIMTTLKLVIACSPLLGGPQTVADDRRILRSALAHLTTMPGLLGSIDRTPDRESRKPFVFARVHQGKWEIIDPKA